MEVPQDMILVRHGRAESNEIKTLLEAGRHAELGAEIFGRHSEDHPLTEEGQMRHAYSAGRWVSGVLIDQENLTPDNYFTSPLTRAEQTAATIGLEIEKDHPELEVLWTRDRNLREIQHDYSDRARAEEGASEKRLFTTKKRLYRRFGNGESIADGMARWRNFQRSHAAELAGRVSLIVAHGHLMGAVQVEVEGQGMSDDEAMALFRERDMANCNILHYTSVDPESKRPSGELRWVRALVPYETHHGTHFDWQEFTPRKVSSAQLLADNAGFARLLNQAVEFQQQTLFS